MQVCNSVRALLAMGSVLFPLSAVRADLIVAENFDSYTTGSLVGQTATGLGLTGAYSTNGSGSFVITANGLAFSTYSTTDGNRLVASSSAGATVVAKFDLASSPFTGTLYTSYLVRLNSYGTTGAFAETRVATAVNDVSSAARFRTQANTSGTTTGKENNLGIGYNSTITNANTALTTAQTFMVIGRYSNVGAALSGAAPGQATIYALSEEQWANYALSTDPDLYLNTASVGTGASDIWARDSAANVTSSTFSFADNNFLQLAVSGYNGGASTVEFDAVLFGSDLQSVTGVNSAAVPEPGSLALAGVAAAGLGIAGWRRRQKPLAVCQA